MKQKKGKVGRPKFDGNLKMKTFNLPIPLIRKMQKKADKEQGSKRDQGNLSLWLRNHLEEVFKK